MTDELITDLAALWGVSLTYRDATGSVCQSPREAVMEVLGCLADGTPAGPRPGHGGQDEVRDQEWLREAARAHRAKVRDRLVEPVLVAWEGRLRYEVQPGMRATLIPDASDSGAPQSRGDLDRIDVVEVPGPGSWTVRLPFGYHTLRVERGDRTDEARVISAPKRCWRAEPGQHEWGVFTPTYALRSPNDWGAGDLSHVGRLLDVVSGSGGSAVATLPLLACYLDRPFEPSPYRPVSRLFWSEFYLAVERVPEWDGCGLARRAWESSATQSRVADLRVQDLVDYAGVMAVKREALGELSRYFFHEAGSGRRSLLETFVSQRPEVLRYAGFRAAAERRGCDWRSWPLSAKLLPTPGRLEDLSDAARYHVYCQWQMEEQLQELTELARPAGLFLDLPVGVHPGGFDVWDRRHLFVQDMSIGSPPDAFFSHGQTWDSPPLHPIATRCDGHDYWSSALRHHMRFASRLRIDHIMSMHRLFWIPEGREPREGVYVAYPADELYAVLCLESHLNQTMVTGEDLGTVPPEVRPRMRRHGVSRTWVLQSALRPRASSTVAPIPAHVVASLETHDMFPFAGFLTGSDIELRLRTGQLHEDEARRAFAARRRMVSALSSYLTDKSEPDDARALLVAAVSYLARSPAELVLVGLDDLLMQREAHNVPGTTGGGANWRRKLAGDEAQVARAVREAGAWFDRCRPPTGGGLRSAAD